MVGGKGGKDNCCSSSIVVLAVFNVGSIITVAIVKNVFVVVGAVLNVVLVIAVVVAVTVKL